jgi:hypothetical protein
MMLTANRLMGDDDVYISMHEMSEQIGIELELLGVLVVFQSSPARFAVEGGRVLPEPGQEQAWISES